MRRFSASMRLTARWNTHGCVTVWVLRVAYHRKVGKRQQNAHDDIASGSLKREGGSSDFKHRHYMSGVVRLQLVCGDNSPRSLVALFACRRMSEIADTSSVMEETRSPMELNV